MTSSSRAACTDRSRPAANDASPLAHLETRSRVRRRASESPRRAPPGPPARRRRRRPPARAAAPPRPRRPARRADRPPCKSTIFEGTNWANVGCPESGTSSASLDARIARRSRSSAPGRGSGRSSEPQLARAAPASIGFIGPSPTKANSTPPSTSSAASSTVGSACAIPCVPANVTRNRRPIAPSSARAVVVRLGVEEHLERAVRDQRGRGGRCRGSASMWSQNGRVTATTAAASR